MKTSWWKKKTELEPAQIAFINLPQQGRYSLVGPPGSGKTNLLLLRAQFLAGNGEKNVLIITFTKSLCDFIRSGIGKSGHISPEQVKTFHSWAGGYIIDQLGFENKTKAGSFDDATRVEVLDRLKEANKKRPSQTMYSAIFVDEAQDLSAEELEQLLCLSDNICICGDDGQGIYYQDGLSIAEKLELDKHELFNHFRIGPRIAQVADRLVPPAPGKLGLLARANYNEKLHGTSSAEMHSKASRDEQFLAMLDLIRVQLDAFNEDSIGVFAGTNATLAELKLRFDATDLAGLVAHHGQEGDGSFVSNARIHVLTLHGSKGAEFRAVHIYAAEELHDYPLRRTKLAFTAITRARTALNVFRTGPTSAGLENAFAKPSLMEMDSLFEEDA